MFLNIFLCLSFSQCVVSNATTKITKNSKHTNNYQNIITNSKTTSTCASSWLKHTLSLHNNHKNTTTMFGIIIIFLVLCLNVIGTICGGNSSWVE